MKYSDSLKRYINLSSRSSLLLKLPTEAFVKDDFTCEYPRTLLIRLSPVQRPCCECWVNRLIVIIKITLHLLQWTDFGVESLFVARNLVEEILAESIRKPPDKSCFYFLEIKLFNNIVRDERTTPHEKPIFLKEFIEKSINWSEMGCK